MVPAPRECQPLGRALHQRHALLVECAVGGQRLHGNERVRAALPLKLTVPRREYARRDIRGCVLTGGTLQYLRWEARHIDVQVDAIEQRPGDPAAVSADAFAGAPAERLWIAEMTAGARIHRRDQLEACWKLCLSRRSRNGDQPRFERLAERLERAAAEFRQLVEKQYAVVCERDLAGPRHRSAAYESDRGGAVVGSAKAAASPLIGAMTTTSQRADCCGFEGLLLRHRWQDARQALGEHALSGARRADEQQAVLTGRRNRERAARIGLATYIDQIRLRGWRPQRRCGSCRTQAGQATGKITDLAEVRCAADLCSAHQRCFVHICGRYDEEMPGACRVHGCRKYAADRLQLTTERQLAVELNPVKPFARELVRRHQDRDRDRQVEAPALLRQIGRRQAHGDPP